MCLRFKYLHKKPISSALANFQLGQVGITTVSIYFKFVYFSDMRHRTVRNVKLKMNRRCEMKLYVSVLNREGKYKEEFRVRDT
jgi:hypothetical protein